MMSASHERLLDLLADRALVGLAPDEAHELEGLLREHPGVDVASFETAAAAAALASIALEPMPSHLLARIEADALALVAHRPSARPPLSRSDRAALARTAPMADAPPRGPGPSEPLPPVVPPLRPVPFVAPAPPPASVAPPPFASVHPPAVGSSAPPSLGGSPTSAVPPPQDAQPTGSVYPASSSAAPLASGSMQRASAPASNVVPLRPRSRALLVSGWVAAAAIAILAIGAYVSKGSPGPIATVPPPPSGSAPPLPSAPPAPKTAAEEREALLARAGTVRTDWSATKDPSAKGASGDVVWNAAEQKGYMRFRGLEKNDPRAAQYQLWIFDKTRDDKYPVDGGVFDVSGDEVVVPITARLSVADAALFAVTVEKPGGVVVSKRERIVVTAKPLG